LTPIIISAVIPVLTPINISAVILTPINTVSVL
jgi:hypothetical protein